MPYDHNSSNSETPRPSEMRRRSRVSAQERKARKRKLYIRRAIIVAVGLLILFLAIFLFVQLIRLIFGIGKNNDEQKTETQKIYSLSSETTAPEGSTEAVNTEALNFVTPDIKDDQNATGHLSEYDNSVYIYNNMALELFNGSDASAQDYAKAISEFKKSAPEYTVYNMVVPNHTEYALPRRLIEDGTVTTTVQSANIKKIYESYTEDVKPINCYNTLAEHLGEYTYFNTDRYWTGLGAYYAIRRSVPRPVSRRSICRPVPKNPSPDLRALMPAMTKACQASSIRSTTGCSPIPPMRCASPRWAPRCRSPPSTMRRPPASLAYGVFLCGDSPLFVAYNDTADRTAKRSPSSRIPTPTPLCRT